MEWKKVSLFCPKCGKKVWGNTNEKQIAKMRCDFCGTEFSSCRKSARYINIKMFISDKKFNNVAFKRQSGSGD